MARYVFDAPDGESCLDENGTEVRDIGMVEVDAVRCASGENDQVAC